MIESLISGSVRLSDVAFRYPATTEVIFENEHWEIESGSFSLVAGSSGSGKSTLLRLLNGLIPHFSGGQFGGSVVISGRNTLESPTRTLSRHAGFVFQDADSISIAGQVEDEIAFGLEQLAAPVTAMRRQVEELLMLMSIEHLRNRMVTTLSGGERQRVAIAAAMAMNPRILILDEPTSQLDPGGAEDVSQAIHRLNEEHGVTIVIAEHRLERLLPHADRLTLLRSGLPLVEGYPREVLASVGHSLAPSLFRAGEHLSWRPLPLSVGEGNRRLAERPLELHRKEPKKTAAKGLESVALRDVELRHERHIVLRDLDLTFNEGEIVAVMGANGSGKTTLLRAIIGLHPLTRGDIRLERMQLGGISRESIGQRVGFLPQRSRILLFNATVREELAFSLRHRGGGLEITELLEEFELSGLEERNPWDISVGQQQSLGLAVTLAGDPAIVLLDEPTRGLDGPRKDRLTQSLKRRSENGQTIILTTHDVEFAAGVAGRIVLLGGGQVIADGAPVDVMTGSLVYGTQINKVFGSGLLTLCDLKQATS